MIAADFGDGLEDVLEDEITGFFFLPTLFLLEEDAETDPLTVREEDLSLDLEGDFDDAVDLDPFDSNLSLDTLTGTEVVFFLPRLLVFFFFFRDLSSSSSESSRDEEDEDSLDEIFPFFTTGSLSVLVSEALLPAEEDEGESFNDFFDSKFPRTEVARLRADLLPLSLESLSPDSFLSVDETFLLTLLLLEDEEDDLDLSESRLSTSDFEDDDD